MLPISFQVTDCTRLTDFSSETICTSCLSHDEEKSGKRESLERNETNLSRRSAWLLRVSFVSLICRNLAHLSRDGKIPTHMMFSSFSLEFRTRANSLGAVFFRENPRKLKKRVVLCETIRV